MYDGYLELGGVELINTERVLAYAERLGIDIGCQACNTCPDMYEALGHPPYSSPDADDAPWFDPAFPESKLFCGFLPLSIDGMDSGTGLRNPADLAQGSAIGGLRRAGREIVARVLAVGADDCAVSYGISWLGSALRGTACQSCRGDELCVFSCCPEGNGDRHLRKLFDVGMLSGPERTNIYPVGGGPCAGICGSAGASIIELEFSLVAGTPYLYHEPITYVFGPTSPATGIVDPPVCQIGTDCADDPDCPPLPARPTVPIPTDPCGCVLPATVARTVITVQPEQMARWLETVPVITIETGSAPLRCLRVRFYSNPVGLGCAGELDPCAFCDELGITYLPPRSTLTVDGRNRTYSLDCSASGNQPEAMPPYLYASAGRAFSWPVFDCPGGMCVELIAASAAPDMLATVALATREDLS